MSPEDKKACRLFLGLSESQLARILYCPVGEIHRQERSEDEAKKHGHANPSPLADDFFEAVRLIRQACDEDRYDTDRLHDDFVRRTLKERWAVLGFFLAKASELELERLQEIAREAAAREAAQQAELEALEKESLKSDLVESEEAHEE